MSTRRTGPRRTRILKENIMNIHIITSDTNIADLTLERLLDIESPIHDREKARKFGLSNWADLSEKGRGQWDHVFGRESRLKKTGSTAPWVKRKIALAEDRHAGFDDPTAGTL